MMTIWFQFGLGFASSLKCYGGTCKNVAMGFKTCMNERICDGNFGYVCLKITGCMLLEMSLSILHM